jgi:hypothetical protein
MLATHREVKQGLIREQAFYAQKVPISGVIFDPVYDMEGRERNHAGTICFSTKFNKSFYFARFRCS